MLSARFIFHSNLSRLTEFAFECFPESRTIPGKENLTCRLRNREVLIESNPFDLNSKRTSK